MENRLERNWKRKLKGSGNYHSGVRVLLTWRTLALLLGEGNYLS